jgi:hypothetical protein
MIAARNTEVEERLVRQMHEAGNHKGVRLSSCALCRGTAGKPKRPSAASATKARAARTEPKDRRPRLGTSVMLGLGILARENPDLDEDEIGHRAAAVRWIEQTQAWRENRLR